MASWQRTVFPSYVEMERYLNGAVRGTVDITDGAVVDNLTLIINVNGVNRTTTFAPAKARAWTFTEILAEIEAAHADLVGVPTLYLPRGLPGVGQGVVIERYLQLYDDPGVIVRLGGTANAVLGFSAVADTTQNIIPSAAVHSIMCNCDDQDVWTVVLYS